MSDTASMNANAAQTADWNLPQPVNTWPVNAGRLTVQFYRTPHTAHQALVDRIVQLIDNAKRSVEFGFYTFTHKAVADAIIAAHGRKGVMVRGVCDAGEAARPGNLAASLKAAGVDVRVWGSPGHLFHEKSLLVDGDSVRSARFVTGSTNMSYGALGSSNFENSVVLSGAGVSRVIGPQFRDQLATAYAAGI